MPVITRHSSAAATAASAAIAVTDVRPTVTAGSWVEADKAADKKAGKQVDKKANSKANSKAHNEANQAVIEVPERVGVVTRAKAATALGRSGDSTGMCLRSKTTPVPACRPSLIRDVVACSGTSGGAARLTSVVVCHGTPDSAFRLVPHGIISRASTLRNEVSKYLARVPTGYVSPKLEDRRDLLYLDGECEYCRVHKASTMDHFWPLVIDRMPTGFCNDEWNSVPACQACNGSKGNRDASTWLRSSVLGNPLSRWSTAKRAASLARFDAYAVASKESCMRVTIDMANYQVINSRIDEMLRELAHSVQVLGRNAIIV